MLINFTAEEIDRIRFIIKAMRRKLSLGGWRLNDEAITSADIDLLQRIVDAGQVLLCAECHERQHSWRGE